MPSALQVKRKLQLSYNFKEIFLAPVEHEKQVSVFQTEETATQP
jgi:hypothetical protein